VRSSPNNPYAGYTIDNWNWEFLKRNTRYRRLYKAVQRFKGWLQKKVLLVLHPLPYSENLSNLNRMIEVMDGSGVTEGMENSPSI